MQELSAEEGGGLIIHHGRIIRRTRYMYFMVCVHMQRLPHVHVTNSQRTMYVTKVTPQASSVPRGMETLGFFRSPEMFTPAASNQETRRKLAHGEYYSRPQVLLPCFRRKALPRFFCRASDVKPSPGTFAVLQT